MNLDKELQKKAMEDVRQNFGHLEEALKTTFAGKAYFGRSKIRGSRKRRASNDCCSALRLSPSWSLQILSAMALLTAIVGPFSSALNAQSILHHCKLFQEAYYNTIEELVQQIMYGSLERLSTWRL